MQPLSVIIPTYNAIGKVEGLLTRFKHFCTKYGDACQVIVTDDASSDGTPHELKREFPGLTIVTSEVNRGFGANVMRGFAEAVHSYIAIVNSDIDLVGNPFYALIEELEKNPKLFAAMPLIFNRPHDKVENLQQLKVKRGLVWNTDLAEAEEWTSVLRNLLTSSSSPKDRLRDVAAKIQPIPSLLCGACFVCARSRFTELGGFDARYHPFYWEDVDLDFKARKRGWLSAVVPRSLVLHRHSESIDRYHKAKKMRYLRINQLRFVMEHQLDLPGLRSPHMWWGLRSLHDLLKGDLVMAKAYLRAGMGLKTV